MNAKILQGDCLETLKTLEAESVQCVVTSPPYYGLRDYGVDGQIGLEETPEAYVDKLVQVFRECRRVLCPDGTLWLNLGDSYAREGGKTAGVGRHWDGRENNLDGMHSRKPLAHEIGLKQKDLIGIPWMVAFALRQPYQDAILKREVDRAWLAGIIDGEGCITSNEVTTSIDNGRAVSPSYPIVLQVRMADRQALEKIACITGVSHVQAEHLAPSQEKANQRPSSCWKTAGDNAMRLLAECYPYLTVKRQQALIAWNLQKLKEGIETKRGVPIPKENLEKRSVLFSVIRALNQRQEVDIPSWCKEPEIKTEPGYYLRSDVIWSKPNPMPESVTDRPTKSHEYIFLLSKSASYYYEADAIMEPLSDPLRTHFDRGSKTDAMRNDAGNMRDGQIYTSRNKRDVWTVTTKPYKEAHFATFPPDLIEPCILAGSRHAARCRRHADPITSPRHA